MPKMIPTNGKVLVEHLRGDVDKVGAIHIPQAYQDKAPMEAMVVAVAGGVGDVKVCDRVVTVRHGGTEVNNGGRMMRLMAVEEILAVIEQ